MPKAINQQLALEQKVQGLNAPNQTGIFGGVNYQHDPTTGGITGINTSLSPQYQALADMLRGSIGTQPGAVGDSIYGRAISRLDPQFAQREAALKTQLANQGLTMGSEAYNNELQRFGNERSDAYGQARYAADIGAEIGRASCRERV